MDNQEAVKKLSVALQIETKKTFSPEAAVREGVEELTLRRGEEGMLRTFNWHHQSGRQQMGGSTACWMRTGTRSSDLQRVSREANTLRKIQAAKAKGDACYDQDSEQQVVSGEAVRLAPWEKHLQNPTRALDEALRRVAAVKRSCGFFHCGRKQELGRHFCRARQGALLPLW